MSENNGNIKSKALDVTRHIAAPVIAAAMASAVTYFVCDSIHTDEVATLKEQITDLEKASQEAKVTQRISEQMEDIAFQQKVISDKQREAAESQKKIADIERGKAEIERGLAQAAERKALESANEAQQMRILADQQKDEAVRNMKAAELARAQTDTLYHISLGETLAQQSLSFGNNINNLSRLLAYSSWYYTKEYGGNIYDQSIFKALLNSSGNLERINSLLKGNVRTIHIVNINGSRWAYGITDYGEIFFYNSKKTHRVFSTNGSNFRDLTIIDEKSSAALTSDGKVTLIDYSSADSKTPSEDKDAQLPKGQWVKLCTTYDKQSILCLSTDQVVWLDAKTLDIIAQQHIEGHPLTLGAEDDMIHIFGEKGTHYVTTKPGVLVERHFKKYKQRVTAYHYVTEHKYHVIGMEDGNIYIINNRGEVTHTLTGHDGAITSLGDTGKYLVSTSYDRRLRYWDLSRKTSIVSNFEVAFDKWPLSFDIDLQEDIIWVGNADGHVNRYCIDSDKNALSTQQLITNDFTKVEWEHYIGPSIPFRSFLPANHSTEKGGEK